MNASEPAKKIAVLGAPIEIGASQRGTLMGPAALRTAGLLTVLEELDFAVEDHGDLTVAGVAALEDTPPENAKHYREIQRWIRTISARAYELAKTGAIPIFLGGDHSLSMGSINGVARHCREQGRELFVMWLDAHADYNTPATTITGNMHGMSAAFLCGEEGLDGLLGHEPRAPIDSSRLELFGTRSIDKLEKDLVKLRRISVADMRKIDEFGVSVLIRRVIDRVKAVDGVLHLSFDVDFLDPEVGARRRHHGAGRGDLSRGASDHGAAARFRRRTLARIVELNPFLDDRGRTARSVVELIASLFGQQITDRPTPTNAM